MKVNGKDYRTVWMEGPEVKMIDQNLLPFEFKIHSSRSHRETAEAIKNMTVRGAGAIGAAGGFGMAQAFLECEGRDYIEKARLRLESSRPTAQNLFYAIGRVCGKGLAEGKDAALREAQAIADEDVAFCRAIGEHGEPLIKEGARIMTHCNAGWLAFVDYGSATAPLYLARTKGRMFRVFVSKTGPRNQGALLTAWELGNEGIPCEIFDDNAAGHLMQRGEIDLVIVGADRIAANGDVANKIGTYMKAVLAREHGIPFYVAAPLSTFDLNCPDGSKIPIEERHPGEVLCVEGFEEDMKVRRKLLAAPPGSKARNPAFDVTPAGCITGIITPRGIIKPGRKDIEKLFS